ncbi:MAG: Crp/Fnr family transcriptional regulator [Desulfarculus sp.]|nr:Crp/Fnr family transcriptional regulator [Desulfarculus sp.]
MDQHWHLSESDFFEGLEQERQDFLGLARARQLKRGEFVFHESQPGGQVYYLEKGVVLIFRSAPEGKEPIMSIRHPGEMFGLAEVLGRRQRQCSAKAIQDSRVHQLGAGGLETLLARHYPLARRVIEVLGGRLRCLSEQMENLMVLDVPSRLLKTLFYLCYPQLVAGHDWSSPVTVPLRLTQEQIAAFTGSCQQTISESLKQLQQDDWISLDGRRITITRPLEVMKRLAL